MDRMIFVAMNGAKQLMTSQAVNNHNLANLNTTGFRADLDVLVTSKDTPGQGSPSRLYSINKDVGVSSRKGDIVTTGRELDVAIDDAGYIAVEDEDGTEAYTRSGEFLIGPGGVLQTKSGFPILGDGGPIAIPAHQRLQVAKDGTILIAPPGQQNMVPAGRIKLVDIPDGTITKGKNGLLKTDAEVVADAQITVTSGALESSNVSPVEALTKMISLARDYEIHIKLMKAAEENEAAATRVLKIN